ncbi:unnamed protein product [Lactuca saligna]|uniref:MBD domain-containing protein n=1 Tax=Lactuca saligna TaxID=75948 RepID=A0AA35ZGM6_LACSI|nr:unnamed protein product [Lactuca saligna]
MVDDDWPEWLPSDWTIQIRKIDGRKVKCYIDPEGHKFYSKPQVEQHLNAIRNSIVVTETEGLLASKPKCGRRRKSEDSNWLPDGWNVEVKYRSCGKEYKVFMDPINGHKFFIKQQILKYLANKANRNSSPAEQKYQPLGDKTHIKLEESQITEPTEANKTNETKASSALTESTRKSPDYEVISTTPADGLPPGWIKEIRVTQHGSEKEKNPFYTDPLSGYIFFSKLDALCYLDTGGDIKICAMRPLRRDMSREINFEKEKFRSRLQEREKERDLKILTTNTEHLTEGARDTILAMQVEIEKKYRDGGISEFVHFDFSSDKTEDLPWVMWNCRNLLFAYKG